MKKIYLTLTLIFATVSLVAQQQIISLYQGKAPGSENWDWEEGQSLSDKPAPVKFPIA